MPWRRLPVAALALAAMALSACGAVERSIPLERAAAAAPTTTTSTTEPPPPPTTAPPTTVAPAPPSTAPPKPRTPATVAPRRATPNPAPVLGGLAAYVGLGTWADVYDWSRSYTKGNPTVGPADVDRMAQVGVQTLYIQTGKWDSATDVVDPDLLTPIVQRAHARGIRVVAW